MTTTIGAAFDLDSLSFQVKDLHKKALLKLLHCHFSNDQVMTYPELSDEIGTSIKTKAWQCGAWKDLKSGGFIVPAPAKSFRLSAQGVNLAMLFANDEELAEFKTPATNEEHHAKIRSKLERIDKAGKVGPKIFDVFLAHPETPMTGFEIATELGCNPDSHGFFYGFKGMKKMGLVDHVGAKVQPTKSGPEGKGKKRKDPTTTTTSSEEEEADEDKQPAKKARIRGGCKQFILSHKAFLKMAAKQESDVDVTTE
jgi:hypothetical protein